MGNVPLEQDWPAESKIIIDEDDVPEVDARPWEKPPAAPANTPMQQFHRLRVPEKPRKAPTPADMKAEALEYAIIAARLGLEELRMSVDWFSVNDPSTSAEYEPMLNQVADFADRLDNRKR